MTQSENSEKKSLLDIMIFLLQRKKYFLYLFLFTIILTIILKLILPVKYESSCTIFPDIGNSNEGGLNQISKIGKIIGLDLNAAGQGTTILSVAYTDIIKSREVLLDVGYDKIYIPSLNDTLNIIDYLNRKSVLHYISEYTIGLPGKLKSIVYEKPIKKPQTGQVSYFTKYENKAIKQLENSIVIEKDIETGIITINLSAPNAEVAALLNSRLIYHFKKRVRAIFTAKNRENFNFIDEIYEESNQELNNAENILASFLIENSDHQTPALKIKLERLQRNLDIKTEIFTGIQTKLTNIKISLKRSEPVIILIEKPNVPLEKSGFGIITLFILILIIVLMLHLIYFYGRYYFLFFYQEPADQEKYQKLISLFRDFKLFKRE